jgi:hypothetical protein
MPFFRRRTTTPAPQEPAAAVRPVPELDPAAGDPVLARLRAAAQARDWPGMRSELTAVSDPGEHDWLVEEATRTPGMEEWLPEVVAAEPDDVLPRLVLGARLIEWAWQARTRASARHVTREQFEVFHARLRDAQRELYEVAERRPEWSAPWYFLQPCGRGLEVGQETSRLRFEATVRRAPGHLAAHRQQLQQVCAKWSGSHELMHAFARESMLGAAPGSPLGELVAIGHLEQWLRDEGGTLKRPETVASLHEAADRSIRHPDYRRTRDWARTFNVFAMAFSLAGERAAAKPLFDAIGDRVTRFPWMYHGGGVTKAFAQHRDAAG